MANTAALLGTLLNTNADINYYTQQQIFWANKQEANSKKLQVQVKAEDKWEAAYDEVYNADGSKDVKLGGQYYVKKAVEAKDGQNGQEMQFANVNPGTRNISGHDVSESRGKAALAYANAKVKEYSQELSEELAELDIEYDTMKCMYETLLEEMRAQKDTEASATQTAAQDTGLLNAG